MLMRKILTASAGTITIFSLILLPFNFFTSTTGKGLTWETAEAKELLLGVENTGSPYLTYDQFIDQLHHMRDTIPDNWTRALAVTIFVRSQAISFGLPGINVVGDTPVLLERVQNGEAALCNDMATLSEFALNEAGLHARRYHIASNTDRVDTHVTLDVWMPFRKAWVMIDPTFGGYYTLDTLPVSTPKISQYLRDGKHTQLKFTPLGTWESPRPENYYIDPRLLYGVIEAQNPLRALQN